jgi:hypothetical protein
MGPVRDPNPIRRDIQNPGQLQLFQLRLVRLHLRRRPGVLSGAWDALLLAVKAGIDLTQFDDFARADCMEYVSVDEPYGGHPLAATRRAIVRAAVEIGRNMK